MHRGQAQLVLCTTLVLTVVLTPALTLELTEGAAHQVEGDAIAIHHHSNLTTQTPQPSISPIQTRPRHTTFPPHPIPSQPHPSPSSSSSHHKRIRGSPIQLTTIASPITHPPSSTLLFKQHQIPGNSPPSPQGTLVLPLAYPNQEKS